MRTRSSGHRGRAEGIQFDSLHCGGAFDEGGPKRASDSPTTATSATARCRDRQLSTFTGEMFPPVMIILSEGGQRQASFSISHG